MFPTGPSLAHSKFSKKHLLNWEATKAKGQFCDLEVNLRYHICVPAMRQERLTEAGSRMATEGGDRTLLNDLNQPVSLTPKLFEFSLNSGCRFPMNP